MTRKRLERLIRLQHYLILENRGARPGRGTRSFEDRYIIVDKELKRYNGWFDTIDNLINNTLLVLALNESLPYLITPRDDLHEQIVKGYFESGYRYRLVNEHKL